MAPVSSILHRILSNKIELESLTGESAVCRKAFLYTPIAFFADKRGFCVEGAMA
jgi:hypothetical protein